MLSAIPAGIAASATTGASQAAVSQARRAADQAEAYARTLRAQADDAQREAQLKRSKADDLASAKDASTGISSTLKAVRPPPIVNMQGQTTGRLLNTTA